MDSKIIKVLFVCFGNICRSPAAEGAFKKLIKDRKISQLFNVDSAGISNYHTGEEPDYRTKKVAKERNIELNHIARQFRREDFLEFDYIFAMDISNYNDLLRLAKSETERKKIYLFREFDPIKVDKNVPDPYNGDIPLFREVQDIVERTSEKILDFILSQHKVQI